MLNVKPQITEENDLIKVTVLLPQITEENYLIKVTVLLPQITAFTTSAGAPPLPKMTF